MYYLTWNKDLPSQVYQPQQNINCFSVALHLQVINYVILKMYIIYCYIFIKYRDKYLYISICAMQYIYIYIFIKISCRNHSPRLVNKFTYSKILQCGVYPGTVDQKILKLYEKGVVHSLSALVHLSTILE